MPRNQKTQAQMQKEINQLKAENQQLRLVFRIIIDTAFHAINKYEPEEEKEENHE